MTDPARRAIAHAALSGPFAPARFLYAATDAASRAEALGQLAPLCHEVVRDGDILWTMHTAERAQTLKALVRQPDLLARLWRKRPPLKDDAFGHALKACLTGTGPLDADALCPEGDDRQPRLRAAISAAILAQALVPADRRAEVRAFEMGLYRRSLELAEAARRKLVLPRALSGRTDERTAALAFMTGAAAPAPAETLAGDPGRLARVMLITGSPGMGKSAFLADLRPRLDGLVPPRWVISFDFDKTTLAHGGPVAWTEEVTRQIGMQAPDLAGPLSAARGNRALERQSMTGEATISAADLLLEDTRAILTEAGPRPFAVVLDTIEEITAQDMRDAFAESPTFTLFYRLLAWLDRLASLAGEGPGAVTAIASGRTAPPVDDRLRALWFDAWLDLAALAAEDARELLALRCPELPEPARAALVAAVGGHPLHLLLTGRHLDGLAAKDRARVIDDLGREGLAGMPAETVLRTLYSRFLDRLRVRGLPEGLDRDAIKALAHPGLLLREVTEPLLAEVIAPAVGVDLSPPGHAAAAFRALGEQVWLVSTEPGGTRIRHRRDVRRVMLPMMLSRPEPSHLRVLDAAIARHQADGLPDEAAYLQALKGDTDWLRAHPERAGAVLSLAGEDLEVMRLSVRALLKHFAPQAGALSRAEIDALPPDLAREAREAEDLRSMRQTGARAMPPPRASAPPDLHEASEFVVVNRRRDIRHPPMQNLFPPEDAAAAADPLPRLADWIDPDSDGGAVLNDRRLQDAMELAFDEADFEQVSAMGWDALARVGQWPDLTRPLPVETPWQDHWLWRLTLTGMIVPPPSGWREIGPFGLIASGEVDAKLIAAEGVDLGAAFYDFDALCQDRPHGLPEVETSPMLQSPSGLRLVRVLTGATLGRAVLRAATRTDKSFLAVPAHLPLLARDLLDWLARSSDVPRLVSGLVEGHPGKPDFAALAEALAADPGRVESEAERIFAGAAFAPGDTEIRALVRLDGPVPAPVLRLIARGQTPELHRAVAAALLNRLPRARAAACFEPVAAAAPVWPKRAARSLEELVAPRTSEFDRHDRALELIRYADICGLLPRLVTEMAARGPAPQLKALKALFDEMDRRWTWPGETG
ncbi:hypothetical protein [Rhodovulum visakhapatnamense]|uniref:AAA ATPase-like protein n=1 Tax=Rhodovulum visakhapatnamense TaxID=364297 RepID=A0A4R8G4K9_9RHOB|nr:hypothetical protein [Rhodovulum visakhapatnamense]TDX33231.1 hypothetical protein EV657_102106 [Rhodovulum visakhapatnamense]